MSEWIQYDGRGVPQDARPGVTICRFVAFPGAPLNGDRMILDAIWAGDEILWDWSRYGRPAIDADGAHGIFPKITHYRNPSQSAVEALKAIAENPKRKFRKLVKA